MAFDQFLGGLAVLIAQFQNISTFAAVVTWLGTLATTLDEADGRSGPDSPGPRRYARGF